MQNRAYIYFAKNLIFSGAFWFAIAVLPLMAWAGGGQSDKITMYAVNYPLKYFAERIGGEHVKVVFPAPADGDPAYWMPDAKTISDFQKANLILLNGANYAKWVNKVSLSRSRMVNTSAKFKEHYITMEETLTHSHGAEGEHAHESLAFTIWIDFDLAAKQAKSIAKALSRKNPSLGDVFQKNYTSLEKDLMKLDREIKTIVSKDPSRPLVVSHPVYDYFAKRYRLNIKSVHWEPDEVPSAEQMIELKNLIKEHPAKWMIWEGDPIEESVEKLKATGIHSLVFDPCGNIPDKGGFISVMRENVNNLRMAFE